VLKLRKQTNEPPPGKLQGIPYHTSPPLMGGDKGEGEQEFYHSHLSSPIKGEELHSNPVAPLSRDLRKAPTSYRELSS